MILAFFVLLGLSCASFALVNSIITIVSFSLTIIVWMLTYVENRLKYALVAVACILIGFFCPSVIKTNTVPKDEYQKIKTVYNNLENTNESLKSTIQTYLNQIALYNSMISFENQKQNILKVRNPKYVINCKIGIGSENSTEDSEDITLYVTEKLFDSYAIGQRIVSVNLESDRQWNTVVITNKNIQ